jgi:hypothetical protein
MAVKVMVAPAIARGEIAKPKPASASAPSSKATGGPAKQKRRRTSVYDADGTEVFITLMCLKCHKMRPLSQFGLRKMADGAIRNQPWCRTCRSGSSERPRKGSEETVESPAVAGSPLAANGEAAPAAEPQATRRPSATVAAEVAAALAAGLGR